MTEEVGFAQYRYGEPARIGDEWYAYRSTNSDYSDTLYRNVAILPSGRVRIEEFNPNTQQWELYGSSVDISNFQHYYFHRRAKLKKTGFSAFVLRTTNAT